MSDFYNADIEENMRSPLAPQGGTCYILFSLKAEDSRLLLSAKEFENERRLAHYGELMRKREICYLRSIRKA